MADIQVIVNDRTALHLAKEVVAAGQPITLSLLLQLHARLVDRVRGADKTPGGTRARNAVRPADFPIRRFRQTLDDPRNAAMPFLRNLREAGKLVELGRSGGGRSAVLAFRELLNCAESHTIR